MSDPTMGLAVIQVLDKVSPIEVTNQFYKLYEVLVSGYLLELTVKVKVIEEVPGCCYPNP